ncbi:adenine phosphoribosyltransferase 5-like isoform X3 [Durio zibethinus]|uniref:adenine phosphoribosyltransferase n=2 Tax=Durio zibethinus TaxID=66656 RepID=A0A6P6BJ82_DURZI|nr:adenine phosphoribosyltransferase 5-like isoform X3 [Durio zibethinus]
MFAGDQNGLQGDPRLKAISEAIRVVPHFPKPGIMFQDITTLLLDHKAFKDAVDIFVDRYRDMDISVVAGVEARGFMFGPSIALAIGAKFVPLRKPRKLPGEVISEAYVLEYGTDCLEMHVGAVQPGERALVIDDLVATGGTLCAAIRLLGTTQTKWKAVVYSCGATPADKLFCTFCYHNNEERPTFIL